jgi:ribosome maturation factor RimP
MISRLKLIELVEAHLAGRDIFLVDAVVKAGNRISVFIDGDHGVTIENCRELNHFLNESIDRDMEDFELTVSSTGADRPLQMPRQYKKNTGKSLDVITVMGEKISGVVIMADDTGIELTVSPPPKKNKANKTQEIKTVSLKYSDIRKATEVITFKQ